MPSKPKTTPRLRRLKASHADILAHRRGEQGRVRTYTVTVPEEIDVKKLRLRLGFSQADFSRRYGFDVRCVQDWEQKRRKPDRAARVLLTVIAREPEAVDRALE